MLELSNQLGLQGIEFSGPLSDPDKWQAYQDADIFILPTYTENFGICVAESSDAGTPAIVTKGAPWERLESYSTGKWIDIGIYPLFAALQEMMSLSRNKLNVMGINGRAWMVAEYSWRYIGKKMAETYETIISVRTKPDWVYVD